MPRTVLCVDDNRAFVDNIQEILGEVGYATRSASSCKEALERAHQGFDVALVDVRLPDGDGTALAVALREVCPDAQVILLTGFASLESAAAAVRAGAWAYLVKPCATPDLLLSIEQASRQVELLEDKRKLQGRAAMAEKLAAIGTLTAGLSHEIKNPLNAASLQLKVLDNRLKKLPEDVQAQYRGPLALVQDEITRLNRLLQEFLEFARPRELNAHPVDLATLLERIVELLGVEAERAGVRIERAWQSPLTMQGDEERLRQALINLIRNAIQATPPLGAVRVEAKAGPGVGVAVEDTGPGIPEELRQRVFEPFFTTKAAGSGLGLPLVHSIVEQHRGTIAIESGPSGGARFVLHFPAPVRA
jgi:signal transduction histidine kinase